MSKTPHPFILPDSRKLSENWKKYFDSTKLKGRNSNLSRDILKSEFENLVLNRVEIIHFKKDYDWISTLKHQNLEPIFNLQKNEDFIFFTTPLFVDKLENVWKEKSQFSKYDVSKMFTDFWNALDFLKSQNICHGTIHENNLAFDGKNWYISGLMSTKKTGESQSGCYVESSFKSRRFLCSPNRNDINFVYFPNDYLIPSDDMWQLVLMYVITFYGFNPFLNSFTDFIQLNIRKGKCKEISNSKNAKYLKEILTSKNKIKDEDYNYILEIFKNNNDEIKLFKN
jgi:hypothetical protein